MGQKSALSVPERANVRMVLCFGCPFQVSHGLAFILLFFFFLRSFLSHNAKNYCINLVFFEILLCLSNFDHHAILEIHLFFLQDYFIIEVSKHIDNKMLVSGF